MTKPPNGSHHFEPGYVSVAAAMHFHESMLGFRARQVFVRLSPAGLVISDYTPSKSKYPSASAGWFDWRVPFEDFKAALEAAAREVHEANWRGQCQ